MKYALVCGAGDGEYGWEKLFSEWLYLSYARCHGIARGDKKSAPRQPAARLAEAI